MAVPPAAPAPPAALPPPPAEPVTLITIKTDRSSRVPDQPDRATVRDRANNIEKPERKPPPRTSSIEKKDDQCYVKNSSFLSRDIEAQKSKEIVKTTSPPIKETVAARKSVSPPKTVLPQKKDSVLPPKTETPSPPKILSPPKSISPPKSTITQSLLDEKKLAKANVTSPPLNSQIPTMSSSPPYKIANQVNMFRNLQNDLKSDNILTKPSETPANEAQVKNEKLPSSDIEVSNKLSGPKETSNIDKTENRRTTKTGEANTIVKNEESNGVGDKIKKFEKAAEDASVGATRVSRAGSVRSRAHSERLPSDGKEELPPPATPFKDNVHFELSTTATNERQSESNERQTETNQSSYGNEAVSTPIERQASLSKNNSPNLVTTKWQKNIPEPEKQIRKPEPQRIIKPEFKPMPSPVDVTIRSPSLGSKIPEQFPSHCTAFRNVAPADPARLNRDNHKFNEDVNTQINFKPCKLKNKEKYSVSKGSSYFTRGTEEIWLVKKKDIEEIEERVLDSFRRAGGNVCLRSESMRPSSDSGQAVSFTHATMGRNKRQMYARSESLDPQWAGARAQTLKRQTSVACTCGHDKKTRAKSAGAETSAAARPRSRSHGDDNNQAQVLDKYETLV